MEALRVPLGDRCAHRSPGTHLFLDPLEDDDVRVSGHAEGQYEAGEAGQRQCDVEEQDRGIEERRVDAEARDRDDPEEAVEDEEEDRDEDEPGEGGSLRLVQRVLPERRRDIRAIERLEVDRKRTRLQDERDALCLADRLQARDLGSSASDPARERAVRVVDLREGADLAVEHDREVLRSVLDPPTRPLLGRDVLELLAALLRELHGYDRLAGLGVEVRAGARELEIAPGHLGDVGRLVLEEVVVGLCRLDPLTVPARTDHRVLAARDDDHAVRDREELSPVLGIERLGRILLRRERSRDKLFRLGVEDVIRI